MMVSTKGRYALRVMIELAQRDGDDYVPLKELAQRQGISDKYLEAIVKLLVKGGLVAGARGKGGGYRLAREPRDYTVREILQLPEGSLAPVACLESGFPPCSRAESCPTLPMWQGLAARINAYLEGITLEMLANPERKK